MSHIARGYKLTAEKEARKAAAAAAKEVDDDDLDDDPDDDDEADTWRDPLPRAGLLGDDSPMDYFLIPPQDEKVRERFTGSKNSFLTHVMDLTHTRLEVDSENSRVKIWGFQPGVGHARLQMEKRLSDMRDEDEKSHRKASKFAKPEKGLSKKAKERRDRLIKAENEKKVFLNELLPPGPMPFNGSFSLPRDDQDLNTEKLVGSSNRYLNEIKAECKVYAWYEPRERAFRLAGDVKEDVDLAAVRIKRLYFKLAHPPTTVSTVPLYLIDQPTEDFLIQFGNLPSGFLTPHPEDVGRYGFIETLATGLEPSLDRISHDLIDLDYGELSGRPSTQPSVVKPTPKSLTLNERNKARLEKALRDALENIRIFDWEIDMKLRFGQIYLTAYKQPKNDAPPKHLSIDRVADREFINPKFASALAPCMAQKEENMKSFFAEIDSLGIRQTEDSPITEYTIDAQVTVEHPKPPTERPRNKPPPTNTPTITLDTRITCEFKEDGKVGLWRCTIDKEDLFIASMFNAEKKYAWELKLSAAQRVEPELLSSVKAFVGGLRLPLIEDPELGKRNIHSKKKLRMGRLAYTKVPGVELSRICQKKIQRFDWEKEKNDFIIDVCRDEIWLIDSDSSTHISNVEIRLDNDPHAVMYKVSMHKQSWRTRFAENLRLSAGMAPTWSASDFLESEENEAQAEIMTLLMARAREMVDILSKSLPRYWERQETWF